MVESEKSEKVEITPFELEQYHQLHELILHHDRAIWQTPSYIIAIGGSMIGVSLMLIFQYNVPSLLVGIFLYIGYLLAQSLTFAIKKHQNYSLIRNKTLNIIERQYGHMIQRFTDPSFGVEGKNLSELFIYFKEPPKSIKKSAHVNFLRNAEYITYIMLALAFGLGLWDIYPIIFNFIS